MNPHRTPVEQSDLLATIKISQSIDILGSCLYMFQDFGQLTKLSCFLRMAVQIVLPAEVWPPLLYLSVLSSPSSTLYSERRLTGQEQNVRGTRLMRYTSRVNPYEYVTHLIEFSHKMNLLSWVSFPHLEKRLLHLIWRGVQIMSILALIARRTIHTNGDALSLFPIQ